MEIITELLTPIVERSQDYGKSIPLARSSEPMLLRIPLTNASSEVPIVAGARNEFLLDKSHGFLCHAERGTTPFYSFQLNNNTVVPAVVEPYMLIDSNETYVNGVATNNLPQRFDQVVVDYLIDQSHNWLFTNGLLHGVLVNNATQPTHRFHPWGYINADTRANTVGTQPAIMASQSNANFIIEIPPGTSILSDCDSDLPLMSLGSVRNSVTFSAPQNIGRAMAADANTAGSVASLSITNFNLYVYIVKPDQEVRQEVETLLASPMGMPYITTIAQTLPVQSVLPSSELREVYGFGESVRFLEVSFSCDDALNGLRTALPGISKPRTGILSYRLRLDTAFYPQEPILCGPGQTAGYRQYLQTHEAKYALLRYYDNQAGPSVSWKGFTSGDYSPSYFEADTVVGPCGFWRAAIDLSSASRALYSGVKFRSAGLLIERDRDINQREKFLPSGGAAAAAPIETATMLFKAYINRALLLTDQQAQIVV